MSYTFITRDEKAADDFIKRHTEKHPMAEVEKKTSTAYMVKDAKGTPTALSMEPVECKPLEKDADGKDKPGETVEETEVYIVDSDVVP